MATFPSILPSYNIIEIPIFSTTIIKYVGKKEQRISNWGTCQMHFKLQWKLLSDTDKTTLQNFFIARKGAFESFTWVHPKTSVSYTVRFLEDLATFEAFYVSLWALHEVEFIEVT